MCPRKSNSNSLNVFPLNLFWEKIVLKVVSLKLFKTVYWKRVLRQYNINGIIRIDISVIDDGAIPKIQVYFNVHSTMANLMGVSIPCFCPTCQCATYLFKLENNVKIYAACRNVLIQALFDARKSSMIVIRDKIFKIRPGKMCGRKF